MRINNKLWRQRKFVKKWKFFYFEKGKIEASKEYNKKLDLISNEYQISLNQRDESLKMQLKINQKKETEYQKLCDDLIKDREKVQEILAKLQAYEASGMQSFKNLEAMYQDEKIQKWTKLNHNKNELKHVVTMAQREAAKIL